MPGHADERRAARANWPVTLTRLGEETPPTTTTVHERLAMMWELVTQAWAVAGKPLPDYERHNAPVRVLRNGDTEHHGNQGS